MFNSCSTIAARTSKFMPICHKNKFIFFHIPRCGGTSVELAFDFTTTQSLVGVIKSGEQIVTLHHLIADDLKIAGWVDESTLQSYFKFTIIRDPFSRMASDYLWQQQHDSNGLFKAMSFADYLNLAESVIKDSRYFEKRHFDHFRPMVSYCLADERLLVDDILLLDNIDHELKRIEPHIGKVTLPKVNGSANSYQHLRTSQNIERVQQLYSADQMLYERVKAMQSH